MEENNFVELSQQELEEVFGGKNQTVRAGKVGAPIHSGPGSEFAVIAKTTKDAIATYTGEMKFVKGESWIHIAWNGKAGWILAKYVKTV